jgi:hypothetical protein
VLNIVFAPGDGGHRHEHVPHSHPYEPPLPVLAGPAVEYRDDGLSEIYERDISDVLETPGYSRFDVTYGDNSGDVDWIGGHLLLGRGIGIDTEWDHFEESLSSGRQDQLWIGDFNVILGGPINDRLNVYIGGGISWLDDEIATDAGANFTIGGDYFLHENVVWTGAVDVGKIGGASYFHGATTVGLKFECLEIYTGYDYYDIGDTQIDGIMAGLRFWF